jgi:hypothetical protein
VLGPRPEEETFLRRHFAATVCASRQTALSHPPPTKPTTTTTKKIQRDQPHPPASTTKKGDVCSTPVRACTEGRLRPSVCGCCFFELPRSVP